MWVLAIVHHWIDPAGTFFVHMTVVALHSPSAEAAYSLPPKPSPAPRPPAASSPAHQRLELLHWVHTPSSAPPPLPVRLNVALPTQLLLPSHPPHEWSFAAITWQIVQQLYGQRCVAVPAA